MMFWHIGHYINEDLGYKKYSAYGDKILATVANINVESFLELVTIEDDINNKG